MDDEKEPQTTFWQTAIKTAIVVFILLAGAMAGFKLYIKLLLS